MVEITFTNPVYLWVLLIIPFIILVHILTLKKIKSVTLKFSNFEALERISKGEFLGKPYKGLFRNKNIFLLILRLIIYTLLIFSVSGITLWYVGEVSDFDFVVAIDASTSMLADDFNITRLEAAKGAANVFVDSSEGISNIGIVSFASTVFVDKEPISEKEEIKNTINSLNIKESGGTNIGDTLITSANLLITDELAKNKKPKVIIIITDGQSNIGTPVDVAIDYAKAKDIIVHTIGIGTPEGGKILGLDIILKLDESTLKKIAEETNGKYFKAESEESLKEIFKEIASSKEKKISIDLTWIVLIISLSLLALEWVLMQTVYKTLPG